MQVRLDVDSEILRRPINQAKANAEHAGYFVHVSRDGGDKFLCTADYRDDRIKVEVDNGIVTSVLGIG